MGNGSIFCLPSNPIFQRPNFSFCGQPVPLKDLSLPPFPPTLPPSTRLYDPALAGQLVYSNTRHSHWAFDTGLANQVPPLPEIRILLPLGQQPSCPPCGWKVAKKWSDRVLKLWFDPLCLKLFAGHFHSLHQ